MQVGGRGRQLELALQPPSWLAWHSLLSDAAPTQHLPTDKWLCRPRHNSNICAHLALPGQVDQEPGVLP